MNKRTVKGKVIKLLRKFNVPYEYVEVIDLRPYRNRYMVRIFSRWRDERKKEKTERLIERRLPKNVSVFVY